MTSLDSVLNPSGFFFHPVASGGCVYHQPDMQHEDRSPCLTDLGGTWHWSDRV